MNEKIFDKIPLPILAGALFTLGALGAFLGQKAAARLRRVNGKG